MGSVLQTAACAGCKKSVDDTEEETPLLPPLTVTDDSTNLTFTWIDDTGQTHAAQRVAQIPAASRSYVRVNAGNQDKTTKDLCYVADLSKLRDDRTYLVWTVSVAGWEAEVARRHDGAASTTPPSAPARTPAAPNKPGATESSIIIYSASWCPNCHKAADYLRSRRIRYVMKDIEETPGAQAEMNEKLARIGRHKSGIPVIDVRGEVVVGFNRGRIDAALRRTARSRREEDPEPEE